MTGFQEQVVECPPSASQSDLERPVSVDIQEPGVPVEQDKSDHQSGSRDLWSVVAIFLTTLGVFGIYLIQGVIIARILGPTGRGEFGTAMFFPRDVLLYAGLLGGIEIVNAYAVRAGLNVRSLKLSAARLGFISGLITASFAAVLATFVMICVGKAYLIPYCLLVCVFVPWEHMQLTISAVDRGTKSIWDFNVNRLIYAATFLVLLVAFFGLGLEQVTGGSKLTIVCCLFVIARILGLFPTLRGMKIGEAIRARLDRGERPPQASDQAPVPGAWELLKQGRFYALSMLASECFERLDVFLVVAIASVTESGYYFVAVPAVQLLNVAPHALGVFTFNAGAEPSRWPSMKKTVAILSGTVLFQIVSSFILAFLIPILILAFYGTAFEPAIAFALWLIPAYAIRGYLQAADGYLKGRNKPMVGVWARAASILFMLAFVGLVYQDVIPWFEQKLFSIPCAALIGQFFSMTVISLGVLWDVRQINQGIDREVSHVNH